VCVCVCVSVLLCLLFSLLFVFLLLLLPFSLFLFGALSSSPSPFRLRHHQEDDLVQSVQSTELTNLKTTRFFVPADLKIRGHDAPRFRLFTPSDTVVDQADLILEVYARNTNR